MVVVDSAELTFVKNNFFRLWMKVMIAVYRIYIYRCMQPCINYVTVSVCCNTVSNNSEVILENILDHV